PAPLRDETLQDPRTVFQIVKRHFSRHTPEVVEQGTGCPKETFLKVAETILANSGADRTVAFAYAVAWTQHTNGVQMIGACALLQLLLGNVGRPGAGVMALRGHASIQRSTDIPSLYPKLDRQALRKLAWLVVKDNWLHETAQFWKTAPEIKNGEVTTGDIKTEVLFFPATQVAEDDGTYTNTQRLLQFHHKAAEPPGDCRSDPGFVYDLGKRLKKLYAKSTLPRDEGFKQLVWAYESDDPAERKTSEPAVLKILKEIN